MMPHKVVGILSLLLVFALKVRAQGEVVFSIDGEPVGVEEFAYYYRKSPERNLDAFLRAFIDYKLKVRYARELGVDTLTSFRNQLDYYRGRLSQSYQQLSDRQEQQVRQLYRQSECRMPMGERIRVAHISKYLPQHVERQKEQEAQRQMDFIYTALRKGADFSALAHRYSDDEESKDSGGLLPWMPVGGYLEEWVNVFSSLEKDSVSAPFYSPRGIHIVKWVDKRPVPNYEEKRAQWLSRPEVAEALGLPNVDADSLLPFGERELHDGLLIACLDRKEPPAVLPVQKNDLELFFRQHRSEYGWDLPHYKGAVVHCKDKKTASAIKSYLRKKPMSEWQEALERLVGMEPVPKAAIEVGVFRIGMNEYIDKLVFKCGNFQPHPALPYTFVMGKKLKKGFGSYEEVGNEVALRYQALYGDSRRSELRQKYKVEINQEVLKTVNNDGCK